MVWYSMVWYGGMVAIATLKELLRLPPTN